MINKEVEKILGKLSVKAVYSSPSKCPVLPCVSYYTLSEKSGFNCDNDELITDVYVQLDIWADNGEKCGMIAAEVNSLMKENGYYRELELDVPKADDGVYHRSMRFVKSYLAQERMN